MLKKAGVEAGRVHFHVWDYADVWFRDYGPTFVVNRELQKIAIVQWRFNAWGGKYPPLLKDGNIPYFISERLGIGLFMPGIILEGGAIDVNGCGTVLTTEQCLLNPNRNPGLLKHDLERYLGDFLGARHVDLAEMRSCRAMIPTGTSTTSLDSSIRRPSSAPLRRTPTTRIMQS